MDFALNHMTVPQLSYIQLLNLAARLRCVGVEVRNDIPRPLFDGIDPGEAGGIAREKGIRLIGLSQIYPFNRWDQERALAVRNLIATAKAAGAETINLIPRNDGIGSGEGERQSNLLVALNGILPMLQEADMVALVEPLGFRRSSLRSKAETINAIKSINGENHFRLVHDTFHHTLAGGGPLFPDSTGIVHISGVIDPALSVDQMEDEHRVLVDANDRLQNIKQIRTLRDAGYDGPISYECFSPDTHALADPEAALRQSFDFIASSLA